MLKCSNRSAPFTKCQDIVIIMKESETSSVEKHVVHAQVTLRGSERLL